MVKSITHLASLAMAGGLAVISLVSALTIDNQLVVIKNDCFERMAIGHRISPKDIYTTVELKTVPDCQRQCTEEGDKCKSFSFGIGIKGNASCDLSSTTIRETVDLKPIGTLVDAEYDLYIKKLGCKILIEQASSPENSNTHYVSTEHTITYEDHKPTQSHEPYSEISTDNNYGSSSNEYSSDKPNEPPKIYKPESLYNRPPNQIQTSLISIRPDPERPDYTGLGPAIGYFEENDKRGGARPDGFEFEDSSYSATPDINVNDRYSFGYRDRPYQFRPFHSGPGLYEIDRLDNLAPYRPYGRPYLNYYDDSRPPFRPSNLNHPYNDRPYIRPTSDGYDGGSSKPMRPVGNDIGYGSDSKPDVYYERPIINRPIKDPLQFDYDRPNFDNYRPSNGVYEIDVNRYDRPRPSNSYGNTNKLERPGNFGSGYDNSGSNKPQSFNSDTRPFYQNRPVYDDRPGPSYDRPRPESNNGYDMIGSNNNRPVQEYDIPRPGYNFGRPRPHFERPDIYDKPKPLHDKPHDYDRPVSDYDKFRPGYQRPSSDYDRPRPLSDYDRPDPQRPRPPPVFDVPERPQSGYDNPVPERPRPPPFLDRPDSNRPSPPHGYDRPELDRPRPFAPVNRPRPIANDRPIVEGPNGYHDIDPIRPRPPPLFNKPDYERPRPPFAYDRPELERPRPPGGYDRPERPRPIANDRPIVEGPNGYHDIDPIRPGTLPERPYSTHRPNTNSNGYNGDFLNKPDPIRPQGPRPEDSNNPNGYESVRRGDNVNNIKYGNKGNNGSDVNRIDGPGKPGNPHEKPDTIVSHSIGPHGETITSIITEIKSACFRRTLAGKRVTRALVRKAMPCERVEDCQLLCAEEKRFVCEGFNYRLDPSGRGSGDCELLDLPVIRLDMIRDVYNDPDYDIYERDRNAAHSCKGYRPPGLSLYGGDRFRDRDFIRGGYDKYDYDRRYDLLPPYRDRDMSPPYYDDRRIANRRGDGYYSTDYHSSGDKFLPKPIQSFPNQPYIPKISHQDTYLPPEHKHKHHYDYEKDRNYWGFDKGNDWGSYGGSYGNFGGSNSYYGHNRFDSNRKNFYVPSRVGGSPDWGRYGGSYGSSDIPTPYDIPSGDTYAPRPNKDSNYLPKLDRPTYNNYIPTYDNGYPPKPAYGLSVYKPDQGYNYHKPDQGYNYPKPDYGSGYDYPKPNIPSPLDPVEHKGPHTSHIGYDYLKDECSLRTATGFKLHKSVVKKYYSVPNIYECEILCFKEKDIECLSYAYRYTLSSSLPTDNCYISSKSYKQLNFYTDLEPDRDFDIYTMNNRKKCESVTPGDREYSECFWHTRSGQRFAADIVKASTTVNSIVECQLECIKTLNFLCRGFSFRYGSPVIGGPAENCLLTNWPFTDLDQRTQFDSDLGFEIYERGSYGHGCEPNHFSIRGKDPPVIGSNTDQLCYVGYGHPARLLPQAIRKTVFVNSELDCKAECTRTRNQIAFQCMSFSYRNKVDRGDTNCDLSDIVQRDLLNKVDYVEDTDAWLFAWDNYNPECISLVDNQVTNEPSSGRDDYMDVGRYGGYDPVKALDTWRVYSVSGWPCKRGTGCKENKIAGFWYCQLEGGSIDTWDYCCRPNHQCGYSRGYIYQWCYVGPRQSQWRKCSDRYYPYIFNLIDRHDGPFKTKPYIPIGGPPIIAGRPPPPPAQRPGYRPDRPHRLPSGHHKRPSSADYEQQFNAHFLDPPKPGGFGQPRYWPVSYLHSNTPPDLGNYSDPKYDNMKQSRENDGKFNAIQNLIEIIRSNDLQNIQYELDNKTNKMDEILLVKIPLPTNFTDETTTSGVTQLDSKLSKPIDLPSTTVIPKSTTNKQTNRVSKSIKFQMENNVMIRPAPLYRRSFITRTNVTGHGKFV